MMNLFMIVIIAFLLGLMLALALAVLFKKVTFSTALARQTRTAVLAFFAIGLSCTVAAFFLPTNEMMVPVTLTEAEHFEQMEAAAALMSDPNLTIEKLDACPQLVRVGQESFAISGKPITLVCEQASAINVLVQENPALTDSMEVSIYTQKVYGSFPSDASPAILRSVPPSSLYDLTSMLSPPSMHFEADTLRVEPNNLEENMPPDLNYFSSNLPFIQFSHPELLTGYQLSVLVLEVPPSTQIIPQQSDPDFATFFM